MKLTVHPSLVPGVRKSGALPPLTHVSSCVDGDDFTFL
jgi:hypothetical protein